MVYSRGRGCGSYLYRVRVRVEHVQSPDPVVVPRGAVVVQSSLYNVHDSTRSTGAQRRFWRAVG